MLTNPSFTGFAEFATTGDKSAPGASLLASGYLPQEILPAEQFNWLMNSASKGVIETETYVDNINKELNAVLVNLATTPSGATDQLSNKITASATADTLMKRDASGRSQVSAPSAAADIARKDYVDTYVPVGTVLMFAGSSTPTGWLICNGAAVSRTTYDALFAALSNGSAWGAGDGSTTFNLPDMRESAPVGVGTFSLVSGSTHGSQVAADSATLAGFKDDRIQGHRMGSLGSGVASCASGSGDTGMPNSCAIYHASTGDPVTDGTNGTPRLGTTTRGKRIGLNFIIRY